jgi:hypothetical protein
VPVERDNFVAAFVDALLLLLLLLLLVFQNGVCFQTQTHCGTDLKGLGLGFGSCLMCACHDKRRSKSGLLPLVTKPPDLMVESCQCSSEVTNAIFSFAKRTSSL